MRRGPACSLLVLDANPSAQARRARGAAARPRARAPGQTTSGASPVPWSLRGGGWERCPRTSEHRRRCPHSRALRRSAERLAAVGWLRSQRHAPGPPSTDWGGTCEGPQRTVHAGRRGCGVVPDALRQSSLPGRALGPPLRQWHGRPPVRWRRGHALVQGGIWSVTNLIHVLNSCDKNYF